MKTKKLDVMTGEGMRIYPYLSIVKMICIYCLRLSEIIEPAEKVNMQNECKNAIQSFTLSKDITRSEPAAFSPFFIPKS